MFKKSLLVGAIAVAASSVALADGAYVGVGLGAQAMHDKMQVTSVTNGGTNNVGNFGAMGGLYAGYGFNFANQFNLGLEAFGNIDSAKAVDSTGGKFAGIKSRYDYGVRVLPGYQITPDTTGYILAGYVRGNFQNQTQSGGNQNFNANGFQVGLGSQTNIAKNVGLRGDFYYNGFQSKTVTDSLSNTYSNKINTLNGVLSVNYKFG